MKKGKKEMTGLASELKERKKERKRALGRTMRGEKKAQYRMGTVRSRRMGEEGTRTKPLDNTAAGGAGGESRGAQKVP